jgi:hypothetical protein
MISLPSGDFTFCWSGESVWPRSFRIFCSQAVKSRPARLRHTICYRTVFGTAWYLHWQLSLCTQSNGWVIEDFWHHVGFALLIQKDLSHNMLHRKKEKKKNSSHSFSRLCQSLSPHWWNWPYWSECESWTFIKFGIFDKPPSLIDKLHQWSGIPATSLERNPPQPRNCCDSLEKWGGIMRNPEGEGVS